MAFDGAFLRLALAEMAPVLIGARVDKVYMPARQVVVLAMRSPGFAGKLLLSADPAGARVQLTNAAFENPAVPPMLCMLLRKKLVGAKLCGLRQPGLERLVFVDFDTTDELGDPQRLTLACECMGRNANLVLCDGNGRVIDAVRRTDATDTTRIIMPGAGYTPPPAKEDFCLLTDDPRRAVAALAATPLPALAGALVQAVPGIAPIVGREIVFRLWADALPDRPMTSAEADALTGALAHLRDLLLAGQGVPTAVTDKTGKGVDYTFFAPRQYGGTAVCETAASYCDLLDDWYARREQKARIQAKAQSLHKFLNTAVARLARTVNVRRAELEKARDCDHLRKYGELLKANLGLVKPGATVCRVPDYYDPECRPIDIPLSPALSPQQNAQKYFKEYRKQCTAAGMLTGLIDKATADLAYLDSVAEALDRAETGRDVDLLREELQQTGWLKTPKAGKNGKGGKQRALPEAPPHRFVSCDGLTILAGRNNRQNDRLTLRQAADDDVWLHTKSAPGAHVIVQAEGKPVPDSTLTEAAIIAATLSRAAASAGVAVDYCPVRRVKKPAGAAPGYVIYDRYNTAYVDPDPALLEKRKID